MNISSRLTSGLAALALTATTAHLSGAKAPTKTSAGFELSVNSIMRGPKLVGYPPTGLRWSGDSTRLYFEWRRPGDDEAFTYVVSRDGGEPKKLSDAERRNAPPVNGVWDKARRRVLFVDQGDIALVDSVAGTRRDITRTTGSESNPRWARNESAITFVRENNLYIVPLDSGAIEQLTDIAPKKRDPRKTDSQEFVKAEEQKLIEHTRVEAEKKKKAEEKDKARALTKFELADRQSANDIRLSPDGTHAFLVVSERADTSKRPNVPNYVTESSYTEDIPARTYVGDAQDKRTLVVMNLRTGTSQTADAEFAKGRAHRWGMPQITEDGSIAVAHVRSDDNKDRWLVAVDAETGKSRVLDVLHDAAWVRELGGFGPNDPSFGFLPDQKHLWFLSERDGWMHLYTLDV